MGSCGEKTGVYLGHAIDKHKARKKGGADERGRPSASADYWQSPLPGLTTRALPEDSVPYELLPVESVYCVE